MDLTAAGLPEPGRCYIVGQVSTAPDNNRPAFAEVERKLRQHGWDPTNPTTMRSSKPVAAESRQMIAEGKDYSTGPQYMRHMRRCFNRVLASRALFALPGWHASTNAKFEIDLALRAGIPVYEWAGGIRIVR